MRYSQESLEELSQKIDLMEYIGHSVDFVKHSGDDYFALCPFHAEDTPSFAVNTKENYYYCFGCGKFGNIFTWIQSYEGLTFDQAVRKVAELTNSDINEYIESETVSFYKLLNRLSNPRKRQPINRIALDIDKDYNQKFKDEIPQIWIDEGISIEEMKKYEIRIDPRSNRIVYPVYSDDDQLISVKGRTLFKNYKALKIMKYMLYHKIVVLDYFQGMKQAREFIKEKDEVIITEGIKSVMKLDGWGFHNTVSAETSVLNEYQVELLIRMQIKNVVIAFDKDIGIKKIKECCELLKRFANVYVVIDRWRLLDDKDSPCDRGEDVWRMLYERRERL